MDKLRDRFWIWGHPVGCHDTGYGIEGKHSRMTTCESAYYLGARNALMVCYGEEFKPPFDQEAMAIDCLNQTIWSVVGASNSPNNVESMGNLDEILRIAKQHPNIKGAIFDDFFFEDRKKDYTPEILKTVGERLHGAPSGRLDMWVVVYHHLLDLVSSEHLEQFDGVTFWTWFANDLEQFDENFRKVKEIAKGKRMMLGCYLYDYGNLKEMDPKLMQLQLDRCARAVREGEAEGVILLSNTVADLGFEAVELTRRWMMEHGDEPV